MAIIPRIPSIYILYCTINLRRESVKIQVYQLDVINQVVKCYAQTIIHNIFVNRNTFIHIDISTYKSVTLNLIQQHALGS